MCKCHKRALNLKRYIYAHKLYIEKYTFKGFRNKFHNQFVSWPNMKSTFNVKKHIAKNGKRNFSSGKICNKKSFKERAWSIRFVSTLPNKWPNLGFKILPPLCAWVQLDIRLQSHYCFQSGSLENAHITTQHGCLSDAINYQIYVLYQEGFK